jgi:plasmid maintenance system antidote protein VapI|tara:strand:+ start:883 stop:1098 length:216 start_codon:yes stop_codon:yes gene_type:complete
MDPVKELNKHIEERMEEGWSKRDVAAAMQISPEQLHHLISGRRRPTLFQAVMIDREFGIPADLWIDEGPSF